MAKAKNNYLIYSAIRGNIIARVEGYAAARKRARSLFYFINEDDAIVGRTEYGLSVIGFKP